jgi:uncharacterized protein
MLSFDIRSLETRAESVDASLPPDDPIWEAGDMLPSEPIQVTGRLSSAGDGRFYFSGRMSSRITMPCRLCLEDVNVAVEDEVHFILAEADADEADDPDVFVYDANLHELDLRPAIRENWLLIAPAFVQCREDCKGLCASCGKNLNEGSCDCTPVKGDSRWDALLPLRSDSR